MHEQSKMRALPAISLGLLSLTVTWVAGCASPGPPRPPSLHLPEAVTDLAVQRVGDEVRLSWTSPSLDTDGVKINRPITARLCRAAQLGASAPCATVKEIPVKPGPSQAVDSLPPSLTGGTLSPLAYRIELRNDKGRSAGLSAPAWTAAGPAPPPVAGLRAQSTEAGILLEWEPKDAADSVLLDRVHKSGAAQSAAAKPAGLAPAKEPEEIQLRASKANPGTSPFGKDAGGSLDSTARTGETYVYTAERVREIALAGHKVEIRSAVAPPITVTFRDTFPPKPPSAVEGIAAAAGTAPSIDLSWRPNTEPDFAGYIVYRQEEGGQQIKLTPSPIAEPGFHDDHVQAGHAYAYTVTAVDKVGNESRPSIPVQEQVAP